MCNNGFSINFNVPAAAFKFLIADKAHNYLSWTPGVLERPLLSFNSLAICCLLILLSRSMKITRGATLWYSSYSHQVLKRMKDTQAVKIQFEQHHGHYHHLFQFISTNLSVIQQYVSLSRAWHAQHLLEMLEDVLDGNLLPIRLETCI